VGALLLKIETEQVAARAAGDEHANHMPSIKFDCFQSTVGEIRATVGEKRKEIRHCDAPPA
jgi:hypothetical protein